MVKYDIDFLNEQDKFHVDEANLINSGCKMLDYFANNQKIKNLSALRTYNLTDLTLSFDILICADDKIHELNRVYRGKDKPTDVISFALFADTQEDCRFVIDNTISLGEIIISAETASCQAEENEKSLEEEMMFLLSHGILHLLGFDHQDEDSLNFMLNQQEKALSDEIRV